MSWKWSLFLKSPLSDLPSKSRQKFLVGVTDPEHCFNRMTDWWLFSTDSSNLFPLLSISQLFYSHYPYFHPLSDVLMNHFHTLQHCSFFTRIFWPKDLFISIHFQNFLTTVNFFTVGPICIIKFHHLLPFSRISLFHLNPLSSKLLKPPSKAFYWGY